MKLVVGLGNPGPRYETTKHNMGFLVLDRLAERWNLGEFQNKGQAEVAEFNFGGEKVILVKPQTFMNLSGRAVAPMFQFFKCQPEDLIVVLDDLDLAPLRLQIKKGGGTAGHNGLKSLNDSLGTANQDYYKVRLGIGKPEGPHRVPIEDWVLQPIPDDWLKPLDEILDRAASAVEFLIEGKASEAMNKFNTKA